MIGSKQAADFHPGDFYLAVQQRGDTSQPGRREHALNSAAASFASANIN
jgi:hypothetical protein